MAPKHRSNSQCSFIKTEILCEKRVRGVKIALSPHSAGRVIQPKLSPVWDFMKLVTDEKMLTCLNSKNGPRARKFGESET